LASGLIGNPESSKSHGTVHRVSEVIDFEGIPIFGSDVLLKYGEDSVKHIQERMGQGRSWGVAQHSASSFVEQVRQVSCPVGDVQNVTVH
jgi:hypothetical protein